MISQFEWVFARARLISVLLIVAVATLATVSPSCRAEPLVVRPTLQLATPAAKDQDDVCIWVHPTDGALSVVIASDKTGGNLIVYDLQGRILQQLAVTKPGNIDIRQNVKLSGFAGDLVVVNQRTGWFRLRVYKVDPVARTLERIDGDRLLTCPNYGGCLYHSPKSGKLYFLCTSGSGTVEQHEIVGNGQGQVSGQLVRKWPLKKCEGAVADDITGVFYVAEEKGSLWKFPAEPDQPAEGQRIISVGEQGITGDLEGLAIYRGPEQATYLLASDQGRHRFLMFSLSEPQLLLREFTVEGAADSDGIDVTSANLGPAFPHGAFVCHTDQSPRPLLVTPWQEIDAKR